MNTTRKTRERRPRGAHLPAIVMLAVIVGGGMGACDRPEQYETLRLPETPVISLRPTWALVTEPYIRLYEEPDESSAISGHLRRGDVANVLSIGTQPVRVDGNPYLWFKLQSQGTSGWVLGTALETFSSEERALNAARNRMGM